MAEYCSELTCYLSLPCPSHSVASSFSSPAASPSPPSSLSREDDYEEAEESMKIFAAWKERGVEERMETLEVKPSHSLLDLRAQVAYSMRVQATSISLFLGNPPKMCLDQFMEAEDVTISSLLHPLSCITAKLAATSNNVPQSHSKDVKENSIDWASLVGENSGNFQEKVLFDQALLVEKLLSDGECERLIDASESLGYEAIEYNPKYRSNTRVVILSQPLATKLYPRIQACQNIPKCVVDPQTNHRWHMIGLNPSFRFCRYLPPQHFSAHCDGAFQASEEEVTWYTINFYLNSGFEGGNTRFFVYPKETKKVPKKPTPISKPPRERETLADFLQKQKADSKTTTTEVPTTPTPDVTPVATETEVSPAVEEYDEVELLLTAHELTERGPSHSIKPDTGLALIFDHWSRSYLHDGAPLEKGVKYILRTDVLYRRQPIGQACECT